MMIGPLPSGSTDKVPGALSIDPPAAEMRTEYAATSPSCAEGMVNVDVVAPGIATPFFSH